MTDGVEILLGRSSAIRSVFAEVRELSPFYDRFTESFDAQDLIEANTPSAARQISNINGR